MTALPDSQPYPKLEVALEHCQSAAQRGYDIARQNLREIETAIAQASETISVHLISLKNAPVHTSEVTSQLEEQLSRMVANLKNLQQTYEKNLEARRQRLDRFSITLFGRTMSGKSTLMEILTNGDGRSIGIGKQRTTRDVRAYYWKGLEITDVPGVAAFEGEQDEEIAFHAANQADLILFLITDDSPQPIEAERLGRIRHLGKPVLGICNVKVAVDDRDELLLFLRNPDRAFDQSRINEILKQFQAFADQHIPGLRQHFVSTHLRSRFLANQPGYEAAREQLLKSSRFDQVEARIVEEVTQRGTFLRVKSFVDEPAVSILDLTDKLFDFSARNAMQGRIFAQKRGQLYAWLQDFKTRAQKRISATVANGMDSLRAEIPSFAEDHYEDEQASKKWEQLVQSSGVEHKIRKLQEELLAECNRALSKIGRELTAELSLVARLTSGRRIETKAVFDSKSAWDLGTTITAGGLLAARLILGSTPLGWAALAVSVVGGLISWFSDDYEEKVEEARKKLRRQLYNNINQMQTNLRKESRNWFEQELQQPIEARIRDLDMVISAIFALADEQHHLAQSLNAQQKRLGRALIEEALDRLNARSLDNLIMDVGRVPGFATMLVLQSEVIFPEPARRDLEKLLDERVWFVFDTKDKFSMLSQTIWPNGGKRQISIEEQNRIAYVPLDELDADTQTRVKLAQQLTGLHVMKSFDQKEHA